MTIDTIIADPVDFGAERAFMVAVLDRYNEVEEFEAAADITEIFIDDARRAIRTALPQTIGQPLTWPGYDASIGADATVAAWRHLVSRKQLELLYDWLPEGDGSENDRRRKRYSKEFNDALVGIRSVLYAGIDSVARTITMRL